MLLPLAAPPADSRATDVLTVGLNSMDLLAVVEPFPAPDSKQRLQRFTQMPGGQAASAAVALARLGWRVEYIGRFGDDDFGRAGLSSLQQEGVMHGRCRSVPGASSQFAVVLVEATTGSRSVLWHRDPALAMAGSDVPDAAVEEARVVLVDCHETAAVTDVARRARRAGARTVIDVEQVRPGMAALLEEIDVIIAAEGFPEAFTALGERDAAVTTLQRRTGAALVCETLGDRGSVTACGGELFHTPAFLGPTVDTTGAGDVFRAGFIAAWLLAGEHADPRQLMRYASAVSALKCRALGARTGAPTREEVDRFLALNLPGPVSV